MRQIKITPSITNRDAKSIEKYFLEVDKFNPLTSFDEGVCAKKIREGDKKYFDKLINSNLRFVISVAKQYQGSEIYLGDLINAGNEGLIRAAEKFDETKGFRFISYAVWWIRQSIIKYIQENSRTVRLPVSKSSKISHYKKFETEFMQEMQEKPTIEEIAINLKITKEEAIVIVNLSEQTTFSIDKKINNDGESEDTMSEFLVDNDAENNIYKETYEKSLKDDILRSLEILKDKEKFVIIKFFNLDGEGENTLESISAQISTTKERVRQRKEKALHKLKINKSNKKLVQYL